MTHSAKRSARTLGRPDIAGDTQKLWDVVSNDGLAIFPTDMGYSIWGGSLDAVRRINQVKRRGPHKRIGMVIGRDAQREILELDDHQWDMVDCVSIDYGLPWCSIARYRSDHPLMRQIEPGLLDLCTANSTVAAARNLGGPFLSRVEQLSLEHLHPIFGTSANLTGTGVKHRVEDIQSSILDAADLVLDYGPSRSIAGVSVGGTQFNFETMKLIRWGAMFDSIAYVLKRHFDLDLPPDPGRESSPHGHVDEFGLAKAE
ncbi:hypothetical protein ACFYXQ_43245 [Nocardia jiangxiensis]|uniref:YrdC-like domain-containing protein n=1 Tax=Nocardia jiangxiensis TaxID=282685 RepID=A0ABW6SED6_9NOCA